MKAAQLVPDALLLPADFDEYRRYSRMFKMPCERWRRASRIAAIDEIYIDLTDLVLNAAEGTARGSARAMSCFDPERSHERHGSGMIDRSRTDKLLAKIATISKNHAGSRSSRMPMLQTASGLYRYARSTASVRRRVAPRDARRA